MARQRYTVTQILAACLLIAASLSQVGCASISPSPVVDGCSLLIKSEVAAALNSSSKDDIRTSKAGTECVWTDESIAVALIGPDSHPTATLTVSSGSVFDEVGRNEEGIPLTPVAGIGDAALYSSNGFFWFRKDGFTVTLSGIWSLPQQGDDLGAYTALALAASARI